MTSLICLGCGMKFEHYTDKKYLCPHCHDLQRAGTSTWSRNYPRSGQERREWQQEDDRDFGTLEERQNWRTEMEQAIRNEESGWPYDD